MKNKLLVLLTINALMACTDTQLQFNQTDLQKMVGESQSAVIQKLGQPDKKIINRTKTYFIYTTTYENYTPPTAQPYQNPGGLTENMGTYTPEICVTTFEIEKSIVQQVHTIGNCL